MSSASEKIGFVWLTTSRTHDQVLHLQYPSSVQTVWMRIFRKLKEKLSVYRMHLELLTKASFKFYPLPKLKENLYSGKGCCRIYSPLSPLFNFSVKVRFPGNICRFLDICLSRVARATSRAVSGNLKKISVLNVLILTCREM